MNQLILDGKMDFVDPNGRALSDNYYGWAKEVYEHLGFVFACGRQPTAALTHRRGGSRLQAANWKWSRFASAVRETDVANCKLGDLRCMRRIEAFISVIATCNSSLSKALNTRTFGMPRAFPSSLLPLAPIHTPSGASPMRVRSSAMRLRIMAIRFQALIARHIAAQTRLCENRRQKTEDRRQRTEERIRRIGDRHVLHC